jgi:hypothetical protein
MKALIADTYAFNIFNSKHIQFPREFKNYKIIWNMREALLELWLGNITELAIPELGTPGYDFEEFINDMINLGQIKIKPKIKHYKLNVTKKN